MTTSELLESALRSTTPVQPLRAGVRELAREGNNKAEIYGLLEALLGQFRTRSDFRETDEDAVLDVMDALTGWCHPVAELFPDESVS